MSPSPTAEPVRRGRDIAAFTVGALVGYLAAGLVITVGAWPEALRRLLYALQGGGGEGTYWGEPLFYAFLMGVLPNAGNLGGAMVGAAAGLALARAVAGAGGLTPLARRHRSVLAGVGIAVLLLLSWFGQAQWRQAAQDVARYRAATRSGMILPSVPPDFGESMPGCEAGDLRACHEAAVSLELGRGVRADAARAVRLYDRVCGAGWAGDCRAAGSLHYRGGPGLPRDFTSALEALGKACAGGDGWSCFQVGYMHERAEGVSQDFSQAVAHYQMSCDVAYGMGCLYLADDYLHGEGVLRDPSRAQSLYGRALRLLEPECDRGDAFSCQAAAKMYTQGQGVEADPLRARRLNERACQGGNAEACAALRYGP